MEFSAKTYYFFPNIGNHKVFEKEIKKSMQIKIALSNPVHRSKLKSQENVSIAILFIQRKMFP